MVVGVVSLLLEGGEEFDGGGEVDAGFADRFEVTVELLRSGAVSVAEHASVFGSEASHVGSFGVSGELVGVEGFDLVGD